MVWRLVVRHTFFATGHACAFNQLQFSAAFVATETFHFAIAGASLFLNTFGWDILGSVTIISISFATGKRSVWTWYFFYQLLEALSASISVSVLKRHLMVWAIFAPRFVFGMIFFIITSGCLFMMLLYLGVDNIQSWENEEDHSRKYD